MLLFIVSLHLARIIKLIFEAWLFYSMKLIILMSEVFVDMFSVASYFCWFLRMALSFLKCLFISDYDNILRDTQGLG